MTIDIQDQKKKLLDQKNRIEEELSPLAIKDEHGIWQAKQTETNELMADREEVAEAVTEFQENSSFVEDLKNQILDINEALVNIEIGKYGICVTCSNPIEEDRLLANPAALTCKLHMK